MWSVKCGVRSVEECEGAWRSVEECGGVWSAKFWPRESQMFSCHTAVHSDVHIIKKITKNNIE